MGPAASLGVRGEPVVKVAIPPIEPARGGQLPGRSARTTHFDALVLNVETRGGVSAVRALGQAGRTVAAGAWNQAPGLRSRYASSSVVLPNPYDDFDLTAERLLEWVSSSRADAILAAGDVTLALLNEYRDALGPLAPPAIASPEAIRIEASKAATLTVAEALGIPAPRSFVVSSTSDALEALLELGVPAVIKPDASFVRTGRGGCRETLAFAPSVEEGVAAAQRLLARQTQVVVQELLTGTRENHLLFRREGKVIARCVLVAERTWPPLGGLTVMRSTIVPPEDSLRHTERLLDGIGLEGFAEVEFRRDALGKPRLMEVNARITQALAGSVVAGINFPDMLVRWMRGQPIEAPSRYPVGLRVGWLMGDLRLLAAAYSLIASETPPPAPGALLKDLTKDYILRRARIEDIDRSDLRPFAAAAGQRAGAALGHMWRRRSHPPHEETPATSRP